MNVTFVYSENWSGMYINGQLAIEGYDLEPELIAKKIVEQFANQMPTVDKVIVDQEWFDDKGVLPEELRYIKEARS